MTETKGTAIETSHTEADSASSDSAHRSRRSLITGAAAALGALAAQAVVLPSPASAASVLLGGISNAATPTLIQNNAVGAGARAVHGRASSPASSTSIGVTGESLGSNGIGVYGIANTGASARGVLGRSTNGNGVRGESTNSYAGAFVGGPNGVYAKGTSAALQAEGGDYGVYANGFYGVVGIGGPGGEGIHGESAYTGVTGLGPSYGVHGRATGTTGTNYGVYGSTASVAGYAGYFDGMVTVTGNLTKAAGSFKIDHPLDPEQRWLSHSFVESPDMKNVYDGNVITDAKGLAVVRMPRYFHALNRDFRYQLTVIGTMAQAVIDREIDNGRFRIRTSEPEVKVSWQVTGIRQDDYANAHRIRVDTRKTGKERGTRLFVPKGSGARKMDLGPVQHHKVAKPRKPKAVKG